MGKDIYYLKHDTNAHRDPRMMRLRAKWGNEGYGAFWIVAEMLREQDCGRFSLEDIEVLAVEIRFDRLAELVNDCYGWGLMEHDETSFWSPRVVRDMGHLEEVRQARKKAGSKGGKAKAQARQAPTAEVATAKQLVTNEGNEGNESLEQASNDVAAALISQDLRTELKAQAPTLHVSADLFGQFVGTMTENALDVDYVRFFIDWIRQQPGLKPNGYAGYFRKHFGEQIVEYRLWCVAEAGRASRPPDTKFEGAEETVRIVREARGRLQPARASPAEG